jgi:hypothetical protein
MPGTIDVMGSAAGWGAAGPVSVASNVPFHGRAGSASRHLLPPTGGVP